MMQNLLCALITLGQSTPQNLPPQTLAPVPSTQTNLHLCSQHIQWVQPRGPVGIPTSIPDHVQCSPPELHIGVIQGILCNKLPKEIGPRMVQARHTRE